MSPVHLFGVRETLLYSSTFSWENRGRNRQVGLNTVMFPFIPLSLIILIILLCIVLSLLTHQEISKISKSNQLLECMYLQSFQGNWRINRQTGASVDVFFWQKTKNTKLTYTDDLSFVLFILEETLCVVTVGVRLMKTSLAVSWQVISQILCT